MYRDFLEAFGLDLFGIAFERVMWLIGLIVASWGAWGALGQWREGDQSGAALRGVVSLGALAFFGYYAARAFFAADGYELFFAEEVVIHTYALAIVTGFLLSAWVAAREGRRVGISPGLVLDMSFWALIFGMIGARVLFIGVNHELYVAACTDPAAVATLDPALYQRLGGQSDCLLVFKFWEGGLVFYGAFLGAASCVWVFARRNAIRPLVLLDTTIPSLALGQAFGRLGCLGAGCCWGSVCTTEWGVRYAADEMPALDALTRLRRGEPIEPGFLEGLSDATREAIVRGHALSAESLAGVHTAYLHPTQLYESLGELGIFLALLLWRPYKRIHGEILALWMTLYGFWRTLTEMTRGDKVRGYAVEIVVEPINALLRLPEGHATFLSTSQIIGLLLGVSGLAMFVVLRRRAAVAAPELSQAAR